MVILGIDPGTTSIGYAIINTLPSIQVRETGLLHVRGAYSQERLKEVYLHVKRLIEKWKPDSLAIERVFFAKNTKTAIAVSEARGVILLTTALAELNLYEYTPLEVKKTITGDGNADKHQLKKMLQMTIKDVVELKARDDVFDAIAIALTCHYLSSSAGNKLKQNKGRV